MSDHKRRWNKEEDLPIYLARPGTTAQTPRQKSYGMFSSVEGAYENKTIDFDSYSVGRKGNRAPRSGSRENLVDGDYFSWSASDASDRGSSFVSSPSDKNDRTPGVEIKYPSGKEFLQGEQDAKVRYH
ncbi:hypothetical protein AAFF_G00108190 [Aldrovandia affinis]|uniref:Uncharacterized protein n=1 Tax=Aldrovandia affinis TaxID=143900 RepID=A0AAD7RU44_9TELE|nr:hypothetical protein AAFF_G00108190 [Aldrovandia affinis]